MDAFQKDLIDRLARIESKLETGKEFRKDHEDRIRALEAKTGKAVGVTMVVWPIFVAVLTQYFKKMV